MQDPEDSRLVSAKHLPAVGPLLPTVKAKPGQMVLKVLEARRTVARAATVNYNRNSPRKLMDMGSLLGNMFGPYSTTRGIPMSTLYDGLLVRLILTVAHKSCPPMQPPVLNPKP